jgi:hypothetical protein
MSDFFIAGSWRNRDAVLQVVSALERTGASTYSFVRTQYDDDASAFAAPGGADEAALDDPGIRKLFAQDLEALREADQFVLVLPAGAAAHIEAGIAFGLGKRCFAVGPVDRSETLYRIFDAMTADAADLVRHLETAGPPRS